MTELKTGLPAFSFMNVSEEENKKIIELEKEQERKDCLDSFYRCGIGKEYLNYDLKLFDDKLPEQKEMKNKAREYFGHIIHGDKSNLIITGSAGEGKTHLVVGLLKEFCFKKKIINLNGYSLEGHYTVKYITSKDLCDIYRKTQKFNTDYSTYSFYRDFARSYDVLAIDELGKSTDKFEWEILFDILDKRMQEGKSTILVSNMAYDDLNKNLADYGMSRMNIDGNLIIINSKGIPDIRQK